MNKSSVRRVRVELKPIREVLCTEEDEKKPNKEMTSYYVKTSTSNKKNKGKVKKVYLNQLNHNNKDNNSRNRININNNTCTGFNRNNLNFSSDNKTANTVANTNTSTYCNNHAHTHNNSSNYNNNTLTIHANKKQLVHNNKQNKLIRPLKVNISFRLHKPSSHNHSITNILTHNNKLSITNRNCSYTNYNNNSHFHVDNESHLNREYRLTMFTLKHKLNSLQQSEIKPSSINTSSSSLSHKKSISNTLSPHPSIRLQKKLNCQNAIRVRIKTSETLDNKNHPIERNKYNKPKVKIENEKLLIIKETLSTKHKTDAVKLKPHDKPNKSNAKTNTKLKHDINHHEKHKDAKCLTSLKKTHLTTNSVLRNGSYFTKGKPISDFNPTTHNANPSTVSKAIHHHSQSFNHKGSNIINNVLHI